MFMHKTVLSGVLASKPLSNRALLRRFAIRDVKNHSAEYDVLAVLS